MNSKLREQLLRLMRYSNTLTPHKLDEPLDPLVDDALSDTEKAIRQAVGEEMLGLTSGLERWIEYNKHDMGELGEFIRTRYAMSGLNELRQKIKQWQGGEDETG